MALSKLDLAVAALLITALLWIEHGNRIVIGSLAASARAEPTAVSPCPLRDDMPFSADCLKAIDGVLPATVRPPTGGAASSFAPSLPDGA
jgi:hypothetical protein